MNLSSSLLRLLRPLVLLQQVHGETHSQGSIPHQNPCSSLPCFEDQQNVVVQALIVCKLECEVPSASPRVLWLVYALDSPSCPSEHMTDIRDPLLKLSGGPNSSFPDVKRSSFPRNGDSPSLNATNSRI